MRIVLISWLLLFAGLALAKPAERYPFSDPHQREQFAQLLYEVRCLVCQNQNLADSNALLAEDLRQEIYVQIRAGKTSEEIITYLTERYGDFILYRPPLNAHTWLLWFAPVIGLLLGAIGGGIYWWSQRNKNQFSHK